MKPEKNTSESERVVHKKNFPVENNLQLLKALKAKRVTEEECQLMLAYHTNDENKEPMIRKGTSVNRLTTGELLVWIDIDFGVVQRKTALIRFPLKAQKKKNGGYTWNIALVA